MNRLGMLIDLLHVSHQMMVDVLAEIKAPVIFCYSSAYALSKHHRNVPDDVLRGVAKNGGVVMVTFVPMFLDVENAASADIHKAADHIFHIAEVAGWDHVGAGSDFDGTGDVPIGLEDVSTYPQLAKLLLMRGATDEQVRKFAGENILRVWSEVEDYSKVLKSAGEKPNEELGWGGNGHGRTCPCRLCFMIARVTGSLGRHTRKRTRRSSSYLVRLHLYRIMRLFAECW